VQWSTLRGSSQAREYACRGKYVPWSFPEQVLFTASSVGGIFALLRFPEERQAPVASTLIPALSLPEREE
jgi:hypothetical protein